MTQYLNRNPNRTDTFPTGDELMQMRRKRIRDRRMLTGSLISLPTRSDSPADRIIELYPAADMAM